MLDFIELPETEKRLPDYNHKKAGLYKVFLMRSEGYKALARGNNVVDSKTVLTPW